MIQNKEVKQLLDLIEEVKNNNEGVNKIRLLYGPKTEDFIASIDFPDYVVLTWVNSDYINDGNIYVLKDFEEVPPIKFVYQDTKYEDCIYPLFKNM